MNDKLKALDKQHAQHKKIIESNNGKTYHQRMYNRGRAAVDDDYKLAVNMAKVDADGFMSKVTTHTHPDHSAALSAYTDKYGSDKEKVFQDFLNKNAALMN